jgi:hypothetical protein
MKCERIAGVGLWLVFTGAVATGQQPAESLPPQAPATTVIERTYPAQDQLPWRRVQTRRESGSREVVVEIQETLGVDGRFEPVQEITTETVRSRATTDVKREVSWLGAGRQRRLLETTRSGQEVLSDTDGRTVQTTRAPDLNGHPRLRFERTATSSRVAPDLHRTETTLLFPDLDDALREHARTEEVQHLVNGTPVRLDTTELGRDINGLWQPVEVRHAEIRNIGSSEQLEETIRRPDPSGALVVSERTITRRSGANGAEQVVIETFAQGAEGFVRLDAGLALQQRTRISTTPTADGGRQTVEEVEARNPVALNDPLRVVQRTVTTIRPIGGDRWLSERQLFERDVNGRLVPVLTDTEEAAGK